MSLRNKMGEAHERFLVGLLGGRKTRASGATWKDQMDGRHGRKNETFAFAWDGKSTLAKSIGVSRAMWSKAAEQAAGERPLLALRFYDTERLDVGEDLVVLSAHDFAEVLQEANRETPVLIFLTSRRSAEDEVARPVPGSQPLIRIPPPPPSPLVVMDGRVLEADEVKVAVRQQQPVVVSVTIGLQKISLEGRETQVYLDNVLRFDNAIDFLRRKES